MRFLHTVVAKVSMVNPLVYLSIYLLTIPAFGLMFLYAFPHDFYAPYAEHEPAAVNDANNIIRAIRTAVENNFKANEAALQSGEWKISQPTIGGIKLDKDVVHFTLGLTAMRSQEGSVSMTNLGIAVGLPLSTWIRTRTPDGWTEYFYPTFDRTKSASPSAAAAASIGASPPDDLEVIFNRFFRPMDGFLVPTVAVASPFMELKQRYEKGIQGDPSQLSGACGRMFYLSAVVLTTLGLGDIAPVTPGSRFCVAFEAIAGITLAGLFLNALAFRASSGSMPLK